MSKKNTKVEKVEKVEKAKKPRKTIDDRIKELERKLEILKNKPDKGMIKEAIKIIKKMTKTELGEFIDAHK